MDAKGLIPRTKKTDLIKSLNIVLASMQVLYNNINWAHSNLELSDFWYLHKYFDGIYAATGDHIDVYAEYVRIHGDFPVHTYKEYLKESLIPEASFKETNGKDAIWK